MKRTVQKQKGNKYFFTIPYIIGISDKIKNFVKSFKVVSMAYKGVDKLNRFIKDRLPMLHNNVVYKINHGNCDASYVRQNFENEDR